jgi:hypothetical protein
MKYQIYVNNEEYAIVEASNWDKIDRILAALKNYYGKAFSITHKQIS